MEALKGVNPAHPPALVARLAWTCFLALNLLQPSSAASDLDSARRLHARGDYSGAIHQARTALNADGHSDEWALLLAENLRITGQLEPASQTLAKALDAGSRSVRVRWLQYQVTLDLGQTNLAADQLLDLVRTAQSRRSYRSPAETVALGRAALALGAEPRQVLDRLYTPALQEEPTLRDAHLASGELALEKHDYALAARTYQAALKVLPRDPDLHVGLARAFAPSDSALMIASLQAALELNSNHVGALLLLAEHHLDAEDYPGAASLLNQARQVNPHHPEAWALEAVLAHLQNRTPDELAARQHALTVRTNNPLVPHLIGRKLSRHYRFAEGAAAQRQALAFDPAFLPAKAQLAQDLLRLGQESEGWQLAAEVEQADPYDVAAHNLAALHRALTNFVTLSNATFRVRMTRQEADLYGPRVLDLLGRAHAHLAPRYGLNLTQPVFVEIYPDGRDFAVRTFGMPENHGFLGVCFGPVITANSPASRPGQPFNWEAMLWHEFTHVVTLHRTRNRMPRWLSEGISVFEERNADPSWGEALIPAYRDLLLADDLCPLSELSGAFLAPRSALMLQFAYYESSLAVEFITRTYGFDSLQRVLHDLAEGQPINQALARHAAPLTELDTAFRQFARQTAQDLAPDLRWDRPPERASAETLNRWAETNPTNYHALLWTARLALQDQRWREARTTLERLLAAYPHPRDPDNPCAMLAEACRGLQDRQAERDALRRLVQLRSDQPAALARLIELATLDQDWKGVLRYAQQYLAINPLVPAPYLAIAQAADHLKQPHQAIPCLRALLTLDPPNPAETRFQLARQLHAAGQPDAYPELLQALEENPRHRPALQLLLQLHAERTPAAADAGADAATQPQPAPGT